ncbi:MAG: GH36-type glycosyl hydrolase domain-containing protein [bacterium]
MEFSAQGKYGCWENDESGMPRFRLTATEGMSPHAPFKHLVATGRLSGFLNRWGNVELFTTEGATGHITITENKSHCRSGLYAMLREGSDYCSLIHGELRGEKEIAYGCGLAQYRGSVEWRGAWLEVEQCFAALPGGDRSMAGWIIITNRGNADFSAEMEWRSDIRIAEENARGENTRTQADGQTAFFRDVHPAIGDVFITTNEPGWEADFLSDCTLVLRTKIEIAPKESIRFPAAVGYGSDADAQRARDNLGRFHPERCQDAWAEYLKPAKLDTPEAWMREECLWTQGQLLAFANYDSSVEEPYLALGGYGWRGFSSRECGENSMIMAPWYPDLAKGCLRFMAKTQYDDGFVPAGHNFKALPAPRKKTYPSDIPIWLMLGVGEYVCETGDYDFLEDECRFNNKGSASLWQHVRLAFDWLRQGIGAGPHGLVRILYGDWNDYLSTMGRGNNGESTMNTGMVCRALDRLIEIARKRNENELAEAMAEFQASLREAMTTCFDETHFIRGYTDKGRPIGSREEGRVFLNAQSWAALGQCGTPEQRRQALLHAVKECHTERGLCLMSQPFSSPAPPDVSCYPIPAGEGENAGVWPQTMAWMIWAMAEEGLADAAMESWKRMSLRHQMHAFPDAPFGIFNGPDCYNSHWAGEREGWTESGLWDRYIHTPMNPAVAWQAFAMRKILEGPKPNPA